MSNLLSETTQLMKSIEKQIKDIVFIGSLKSGHECSWSKFKKLADREYDSGYGSHQVSQDLVIAFSDGSMLTRGEYDGSEWWDYTAIFKRPDLKKPIKKIFREYYESDLADLNNV